MKKKGMLQIPAAAIGTDYTCIPFWEETDLDAYFLPHEDCVSEYVHRGIPADRLYPYGIPVLSLIHIFIHAVMPPFPS